MTKASTHLTADQIGHFQEEGFLVCGNVFTADEVTAFQHAYLECLDHLGQKNTLKNIRPGKRDDGVTTEVYQIRCAHLSHPVFSDLIRDPRILDPIESLLGPNLKLILCQGLYKPPNTGGEISWHQDDYYFRVNKENAVVSCWMAFDNATVDSGCMWVIPRYHHKLWDHSRIKFGGHKMIDPDESQAIPIELEAGQIMFHHGAAPHKTLPNTTENHRRALAIHYMDATSRPLGGNREAEPPENMPIVRGHSASV